MHSLAPVVAAKPSVASEVLRLTNELRAEAGARPLKIGPRLMRSARAHSVHMARTGRFEHGDWASWLRKAGIRIGTCWVAENIAKNQQTAAEVVHDWYASDGHRRNMLDPRYTHMGIAVVNGLWTCHFRGD